LRFKKLNLNLSVQQFMTITAFVIQVLLSGICRKYYIIIIISVLLVVWFVASLASLIWNSLQFI